MAETVWINRLTAQDAASAFQRVVAALPPARSASVKNIAIKINLCDYRRPESGAVTDPAMLAHLVNALRERFPVASVVVVENDATTLDADLAFRLLGYDQLAARMGFRLLNLAKDAWENLPVPQGLLFGSLELPRTLVEADLVVNFAKLKTNALTKVTGCLKNNFAVLRMKRKVVLHDRIDAALVDINRVVRSDWCIIDGLVGMEGMGPAFGAPKRCELLLAGTNPVATDACEARLMGFWPWWVPHIRLCHKAGLGPLEYRLETTIPRFRYEDHRFAFDRTEYHLRNLLRSRAGVAT